MDLKPRKITISNTDDYFFDCNRSDVILYSIRGENNNLDFIWTENKNREL